MRLRQSHQPDLAAVAIGGHSPFKTTDFNIDEGLAYAQIRRALKHFRVDKLRNSVFILRIPDTLLHDFWSTAVHHFFASLKSSPRDFELRAAGFPEYNEPEFTEPFKNFRFLDIDCCGDLLRSRDILCVIVPHSYKIDPADKLIIDFEAAIEPPTQRMAVAALTGFGITEPRDELIKAFLDADEGRRWLPMRKSVAKSELLDRFRDLENPYRDQVNDCEDESPYSLDELFENMTERAEKGAEQKKKRGRFDPPEVESVNIKTLKSAPGLEQFQGTGNAVEWAQDLKQDLADYKAGRIGWEDVDKGTLLHGPPGCGKTSFARALAKSLGVPLFETSGAEWMSPDGGDSAFGDCAKYMKASFKAAKEAAPAVLFVDEVDVFCDRAALGNGRNGQWMRDFTNAFLERLDGFKDRVGVVVIGATNHVDPAVRRPGRLDAEIELGLPNTKAREGILRWHLGEAAEDFDLGEVAVAASGMTGADLEKVARQARRAARKAHRGLEIDDVEIQFPGIKRSESVVVNFDLWKRKA